MRSLPECLHAEQEHQLFREVFSKMLSRIYFAVLQYDIFITYNVEALVFYFLSGFIIYDPSRGFLRMASKGS